MIPLEEAQRRVLEACGPVPAARVPLREALGCVTAAPVVATEFIPPFDNTAYDGYAVRAADTAGAPVRLAVVDELRAGQAPDRMVGAGEAVRIMTGAPVPDGADAIVLVEETTTEGAGREVVVIGSAVAAGHGLRRAGDDVQPGDLVIAPGTELGPAHLGVLASIGARDVLVHPRLTVGVFSSGDELVADGSPLRPGQIRDANTELLLGLVAGANCLPVDLGIVRDDEKALADALVEGVERCDALVTSGGVSMGDYDYVKVVLDRLGRMDWMQIAIRPSKPFAFGLLGSDATPVPVFGLPGNPVSSLVSFELLARPALRRMGGHAEPFRPEVVAIADESITRPPADGKTHLLRVHAHVAKDGRMHLRRTGAQGSHQLANSAGANALLPLRDGESVAAGGEARIRLLG